MFLWNMLGALILIPALSYFLLRKQRSGGALEVADREAVVAPGKRVELAASSLRR
ncbi:hypothetical protein D3C76_1664630 [compost metagenome]